MHDDELTRLLRESAPDARPSDEHRRLLRMQLDHEFRRHRRRHRRVSPAVAAALVVLAALALRPLPIGSDSFDLLRTGRHTSTGQEILKDAYGEGYALNVGGGAGGQARTEMREQEFAAGAYDIVDIFGFTTAGRTFFQYNRRPWADPGANTTETVPGYEDDEAYVLRHQEPVRKDVMARLVHDDWETSSTGIMTIAGRRFLVTTKSASFPGVGPISYHSGTPVD